MHSFKISTSNKYTKEIGQEIRIMKFKEKIVKKFYKFTLFKRCTCEIDILKIIYFKTPYKFSFNIL